MYRLSSFRPPSGSGSGTLGNGGSSGGSGGGGGGLTLSLNNVNQQTNGSGNGMIDVNCSTSTTSSSSTANNPIMQSSSQSPEIEAELNSNTTNPNTNITTTNATLLATPSGRGGGSKRQQKSNKSNGGRSKHSSIARQLAMSTTTTTTTESNLGGGGGGGGSSSGSNSNSTTSPPSSAPTYETIDVQNLSHHHMNGYNPVTNSVLDYDCSISGGSSAGDGASGSGHIGGGGGDGVVVGGGTSNSGERIHHQAARLYQYQPFPQYPRPPYLSRHYYPPSYPPPVPHQHQHQVITPTSPTIGGGVGGSGQTMDNQSAYYSSIYNGQMPSTSTLSRGGDGVIGGIRHQHSFDHPPNMESLLDTDGDEMIISTNAHGGGGLDSLYSPTHHPHSHHDHHQSAYYPAAHSSLYHQYFFNTNRGLHHSDSSGSTGAAVRLLHSHLSPTSSASSDEEDFDIFNAIFALISLTSYTITMIATLVLAFFYYHYEMDRLMAILTATAVLLPATVVNILSLKWLLNDNHRQRKSPNYCPVRRPDIGPCGWTARILLHIALLGPILRYVELLRYGVKSWTERRRIEATKNQHHHTTTTTTTTPFWSPSSTSTPATSSSTAAAAAAAATSNPTVPSILSTTLPRVRYLGTNGTGGGGGTTDGLPPFDTAQSKTQQQQQHSNKSNANIDYYLLTVYEDRDCSLLSLFQSLMQCSVQVIAQLCTMMAHYHHHEQSYDSTSIEHVTIEDHYTTHQFTKYLQLTVIGCSLFELGWSLASYHRSLRRASLGKRNIKPLGVVLQLFWHGGIVASRTLSIALLVNQYGAWLAPVTIGHWGVMTIWIMHQGTHFMGDPRQQCSEYLFNMLIGAIYLLQYLNVKDEPTRYKYGWYYAIILTENVTFVILWTLRVTESQQLQLFVFRLPALASVCGLFLLGILAMQLYYWCAHPSGRPLWVNKAARCC